MPRFRTLLLLALTLLALLHAGLLAAPDRGLAAAKPRLEAELSHTLGRAVALDGDFSLHFLPRPWLMAEGVRVANRPEGSEPELLRVARLEMRLALWPLLSGNFEVESLRLQRPVLLLERLADDRGNWDGMATRELMSSPSRAGAISLSMSRCSTVSWSGAIIWLGVRNVCAGWMLRCPWIACWGPFREQAAFRTRGSRPPSTWLLLRPIGTRDTPCALNSSFLTPGKRRFS